MKKYRVSKWYEDGTEIQETLLFHVWDTPNKMMSIIKKMEMDENCKIRVWQQDAFEVGMCPDKYSSLHGWNRI